MARPSQQPSGAQPGASNDPAALFAAANRALTDGDLDAASDLYRRVLKLAPDVVEVHNNLATALLAQGDVDGAIAIGEQGVARRADFLPLHNTLGNAYVRAGRLDDAMACYEAALRLAPDHHAAAINLADLLRRQGRFDAAARHLDNVVAADPDNAQALLVQGLLLMDRGDHEAAIAPLTRACALAPQDAAAANNLAICLTTLGRRHEALALYRDLTLQRPDLAAAQLNLGQLLQGLGRHDEAVDAFHQALRLDPDDDAPLPYLLQSLMHQCAWAELSAVAPKVLDLAARAVATDDATVSPFALAGTEAPPDLRLAVARHYARRCVARMASMRDRLAFSHPVSSAARLRVGYVSPDFRHHSVAVSFRPLLEAHDRSAFEWTGYWIGQEPRDDETDRFAAGFDRFHDLRGQAPEAIARTILADGIDVLIDLAGHTRDSSLEVFELRLAPVQAHYLGYGSTIGADCIQYLITDPVHTPPALAPHCHEQLVYLPNSFMAAGAAPEIAAPVSRADCGLPDDGTVFVNFNAPYKIDADVFAVWMRLLLACPGSVLWLKAGTDVATANLRRTAIAAGVDPARLIFAGRVPHAEHLARHRFADLALDTRLHVGGVTTLDALWAGVPVLTVAGDTHAARTGASMLQAAGLPSLVRPSLEDYEAHALALARDPAALAAVRAGVAAAVGHAPLFDTPRLARHLEWAYREMARRHRDGAAPSGFTVPDQTATV